MTCFPSHLLRVKAWRQSQIWRREKRGVKLEKMARAAGGTERIWTGGGENLLFAFCLFRIIEAWGVRMQDNKYLSSHSKDTIS